MAEVVAADDETDDGGACAGADDSALAALTNDVKASSVDSAISSFLDAAVAACILHSDIAAAACLL